MDIKQYMKQKKAVVDDALRRYLPLPKTYPHEIHEAMYYSVFTGGKRLRPILAISAIEALGGNEIRVMPTACGIELVHNSTLIHDDLPCMDDDDYRRGKLTNHKIYGEGMALLAGDALLNLAVGLVALHQPKVGSSNEETLAVIREISDAMGTFGVIGGQAVDIQPKNGKPRVETLEYISTHKTAALIRASVRSGAILGNAGKDELAALTEYGENIGTAFQIVDDILDEIQDRGTGNISGEDGEIGRLTYVSVFGLAKSRKLACEKTEKGIAALERLDANTDILRALAMFLADRGY
jgi:geranylgeranyl diphosphate synthase type II